MADGYGSEEKPVSLDPFGTIVEVGWPGGYFSSSGIGFSRTFTSENCTPSTGPIGPNPETSYINSVTFGNSPSGNGPGAITKVKGGGTLSGTFFSFPSNLASHDVPKWTALLGHTLSGGVNGGSVTIRASARTVAGLVCKSIGVTSLNVATPGAVQEFRAQAFDFGGVSFIDSGTGQEYLLHRAEYTGASPSGIAFKIFWRKAPG